MFPSTETLLRELLLKDSKLTTTLIVVACELSLILSTARGKPIDPLLLNGSQEEFSRVLADVVRVEPGFEVMLPKPLESALGIVEFWLLEKSNRAA